MNKLVGIAVASVLAVSFAGAFSNAFAGTQPKVAKAQAEQIALKHAPNGKIKSAELEHEKGALVWSFDITQPGTRDITEVLVNAETGAVVDVAKETPAQQRAEARADARAAKGK